MVVSCSCAVVKYQPQVITSIKKVIEQKTSKQIKNNIKVSRPISKPISKKSQVIVKQIKKEGNYNMYMFLLGVLVGLIMYRYAVPALVAEYNKVKAEVEAKVDPAPDPAPAASTVPPEAK